MKEVRPTSGKVLLALMSILGGTCGGRLENLAFLDLFAGTGRVGIEALNRGANPVFFVETLRARAAEISPPLGGGMSAGQRGVFKILNLDIRRGLSWLQKKGESFDIIFADPPYNEGWNNELPSIIEAHISVLKPNGVFVYEHAEREHVIDVNGGKLKIFDTRKYGETALTFFNYHRRDIDKTTQ